MQQNKQALIQVKNLHVAFGTNVIIDGIDFDVFPGEIFIILGGSGCGKSTLLKIIANYHTPSRGRIEYKTQGQVLEKPTATLRISYTGPDQNLIEEFTLEEHLNFHFQFKVPLISKELLLEKSGLEAAKKTFVKDFSSGMKQRLKLALALYSSSQLLLLDEPTAFMDHAGIEWFRSEIRQKVKNVTLIIASNQSYEYDFTKNFIQL